MKRRSDLQRVLRLVRLGLPLSAKEFALLLREDVATFHRKAKLGTYEGFRIPGAIGPKRYSGVKVRRYLAGEPVDESVSVFGRHAHE
jgi:hypothetical protein